MNEDMNALLTALKPAQGATGEAIAKAEQDVGRSFPDDYVDFIRQRNGTEGPTPNGAYVALWPVDQLPKANDEYRVCDFAPGLVLFGSDGSGTAYGFDMRSTPMKVVALPFIPMDVDEIEQTWTSFTEFLRSLARDS
jgi:cell wall assembly regulator SMI1